MVIIDTVMHQQIEAMKAEAEPELDDIRDQMAVGQKVTLKEFSIDNVPTLKEF